MDCFDPESGQVYRETVLKQQQKPFRQWEHRCPGSKPQNVLSAQDCDSLTAMALRKLVCHAGQLNSETLQALPARTAHQIFSAIRRQ
jgi:hypothetical protein